MITKPVFLCGYTSSGKTTVGKELAKQLGVSFFDTDELLARQAGQTPSRSLRKRAKLISGIWNMKLHARLLHIRPALSPPEAEC